MRHLPTRCAAASATCLSCAGGVASCRTHHVMIVFLLMQLKLGRRRQMAELRRRGCVVPVLCSGWWHISSLHAALPSAPSN